MKILMICLGNICRSPLAEGILQMHINELNLTWEVDSAGTSSYHAGELPDSRSIAVAEAHGINIKNQRSRQLTHQDLDSFDKLYVMDSANYQDVVKMCSSDAQRNKVKLIMNESTPVQNINVPDPYWGNDGFEKVFQMLKQACTAVIANTKD